MLLSDVISNRIEQNTSWTSTKIYNLYVHSATHKQFITISNIKYLTNNLPALIEINNRVPRLFRKLSLIVLFPFNNALL